MSERLPKPPEVPPPLPNIEQMADWIIDQELPKAKKEARPTKSAELLPEDAPETYFETRHEIKDPSQVDKPNIKPMIPIAALLSTQKLVARQSLPTTSSTTSSTNLPSVPTAVYGLSPQNAAAIRKGFLVALVLIITLLAVSAIQSLL